MHQALISALFNWEEWERKLAEVEHRKEDMNKLVMNYLVNKGYLEAAEKFRLESGTEHFDIATCLEVKKAVENGNMEHAIEIVNDLNPTILDRNLQLSFRVQQQHFIELIRNDKVDEALEIGMNKLAPMAEKYPGYFREKFERTFVLIIFKDVNTSPCSELMCKSRRLETAKEIHAAILASQSHETDPKLSSFFKWLLHNQDKCRKVVWHPSIINLSTAELEDYVV